MFHLTPFAIAALITSLSCFGVTVIFFIYGKNLLHRIWAGFTLTAGGWAFFITLAVITNNPETSYRFWLYAHNIGIFIAIFNFHAICLFSQLKYKILIIIAYFYGIAFNFANLYNNGHLINEGANFLFNSMYYLDVKNSAFLISVSVWCFLTIFGNYKLHHFYKNNQEKSREAAFLFIGAVIGYFGGCSTWLPMLGFHHFYPITIIGVAIFGLIYTYAIFKHQILELQVIFKKGLIYSILIAFISIGYLLIVVVLEKNLQGWLGYQSGLLSLWAIFLLGIAFNPLRNRIQRFVDRYFFKGTYEEISKENVLLRQEITQTERLKTMSTLSSGIAHEIKNPLTAIQTFAEYLPQKLNDKTFLLNFSKIVGHEVSRINDLVHQLLDYGKPAPPSLKKTNIHKMLSDVIDILNNKYIEQKIEVLKNFQSNDTWLDIDPNQLRQSILNILLNALEAMPQGGQLWIETDQSFNKFFIRIRDSGHGISRDDLSRVFDPFFSRKDQGTGLGLSVTKSIIENHKGRIHIKSEVGVGTQVILELPLDRKIMQKPYVK